MPALSIRRGTRRDVPVIIRLIHGLAEYERLAHDAVATASQIRRHGCGRMEWAVLDWNTPSIRFYQKLGAKLRRQWILTRLTGAPLSRLARGSRFRHGGPP